MNKKICENSLRWILNYRKFGEEFVSQIDCANSANSFNWIKNQSEYIDNHGLDKWINSFRSIGYSSYIKNIFESNKSVHCSLKQFYNYYKLDYTYNGETYEQFLESLLKNSKYRNLIDENGLFNSKLLKSNEKQ
ncbi:hypothetical protein Catovirus_1_37 [Catovirus CTV1]|uniref:Uncharacterized protein n=1 Tax=Catovirus CTV1 TaxID=1977631 RepID=A0A1V0S8F1_9VIRU|nr:hypothetical protein Catovirus_1_37 [Catovirus CTV1]